MSDVMELLRAEAGYLLIAAGWYAFVVYPYIWLKRRYRLHLHRLRRPGYRLSPRLR